MAHRSRLCAALVDAPAETFDAEWRFWAGAVGKTDAAPDADDEDYVDLGNPIPRLQFMAQRVGAPARVHLDIETDDVDAEVARLVALGATEVERVKTWVVMKDPAGLLFCVVRPQFDDFPAGTTEWP